MSSRKASRPAVGPQPSSLRASAGSVPMHSGSVGRRTDGSTTTASCPFRRSSPSSPRDPRGSIPLEREPAEPERPVDQLPDGGLGAGAEDIVSIARAHVRIRWRPEDVGPHLDLAADPDHPVDVVRREAPLPADAEVADAQRLERRVVPARQVAALRAGPGARGRTRPPSRSGTTRAACATRGSRGSRRRSGGRTPGGRRRTGRGRRPSTRRTGSGAGTPSARRGSSCRRTRTRTCPSTTPGRSASPGSACGAPRGCPAPSGRWSATRSTGRRRTA